MSKKPTAPKKPAAGKPPKTTTKSSAPARKKAEKMTVVSETLGPEKTDSFLPEETKKDATKSPSRKRKAANPKTVGEPNEAPASDPIAEASALAESGYPDEADALLAAAEERLKADAAPAAAGDGEDDGEDQGEPADVNSMPDNDGDDDDALSAPAPRRVIGQARTAPPAEARKKADPLDGLVEPRKSRDAATPLGGNMKGALNAYVERIQNLEGEKKALAEDIKTVYAEAKAEGFDTKQIRKLIAYLAKDRDKLEEEETIFDLYLSAVRGR